MIRLRKVLLSNKPFIIFLSISVLYVLYINCFYNVKSKYNNGENSITGKIISIKIDGDKLNIVVKGKEKIIGYYKFETENDLNFFKNNYKYGDYIKVVGEICDPNRNTVPNGFNYRNYLLTKKIYKTIEISSIEKIKDNSNLFYSLKNIIINRINSLNNSSRYLHTFILGDNSYLDGNVLESYRSNGISHLFAISGMHISLLSAILINILKKFNIYEVKRYIIVNIFLFIYMFLVGMSASVTRAVFFFFLLSINKIFYFYIKPINIFYLVLGIVLFINPFIIYDVGFQFSFMISFFLLSFQKFLNSKNYFVGLIKVSFVSFIASLPICIYSFSKFNLLSIIYNMFFVPFVSVILFPLSLLTFCIPLLDNILSFLLFLLEESSLFISKFDLFIFIMKKPNIVIVFLYLLFGYLILRIKKKYIIIILYLLCLIIHYNYNLIFKDNYLLMIDIGQGDSILLHSNNKNMLIDTGGKNSFSQEDWQIRRNRSTIYGKNIGPLLKSLGIRKLDYLVITHGDMDHIGESYELVNDIDVNYVLFNKNKYNYNEKKLIDLLNKKNIKYGNDLKKLKCGNFIIESINTDLIDENDSSIIFYVFINNKRIMFMGDASVKSENYIMKYYDLGNINILKVGHHGSNTSTSEKFLKRVNPDIGLISVGLNNRFGHPSDKIVKLLKKHNVKTYLTSVNGSILINMEKSVSISLFST